MKSVDIIENLRIHLSRPTGRQLYGVIGTYKALDDFASQLHRARDTNGNRFRKPLSVTRGILELIPDDELWDLCSKEAMMPRPTAKYVAKAFEELLRGRMNSKGLLPLCDLELLWAYNLELGILRSLAADSFQVLLLLPGYLSSGRLVMYPEAGDGRYTLPTNLIASEHLWELSSQHGQ